MNQKSATFTRMESVNMPKNADLAILPSAINSGQMVLANLMRKVVMENVSSSIPMFAGTHKNTKFVRGGIADSTISKVQKIHQMSPEEKILGPLKTLNVQIQIQIQTIRIQGLSLGIGLKIWMMTMSKIAMENQVIVTISRFFKRRTQHLR